MKKTILAVLCLASLGLSAEAREVTGKVMAVFHEPVSVNNKWMDKISVTVSSCNPAGKLETFSYSPGHLSSENALGALYGDMAAAAHSMVMKTPYMNTVSGHVTLVVNEQNVIQKSTFWGYNWECGRNVDIQPPTVPGMSNPQGGFPNMPQPGATGMPNSNPQQQPYNVYSNGYPTQQVPQQATPGSPINARDIMRQFGF